MNRKSYVHQISKIGLIEQVRSRAVTSERRCVGVDRRCRESEGKAKIEGYMSVSDEEAHHRTVASGVRSLVGVEAHTIFQTALDSAQLSAAEHMGVGLSGHVLFSCSFTFMLGQLRGSIRIMCL